VGLEHVEAAAAPPLRFNSFVVGGGFRVIEPKDRPSQAVLSLPAVAPFGTRMGREAMKNWGAGGAHWRKELNLNGAEGLRGDGRGEGRGASLAVCLEHVHGPLGHPGPPFEGQLLAVKRVQDPDWDAADDGRGELG
jgi:hypothetical protein